MSPFPPSKKTRFGLDLDPSFLVTKPVIPNQSHPRILSLDIVYDYTCIIYIYIYIYTYLFMRNYLSISADPGLCQGRGGAWDHRRCGTSLSGRKQRTRLSKATTLSATCPSHLHAPACRSPLHAPAIWFSGSSRLSSGRKQRCQLHAPAIYMLQGNNSVSYMPQPSPCPCMPQPSPCPCHLFFREFKTVSGRKQRHTPPTQQLCQLHCSYMPQPSTCPYHLSFTGFKTAVCPASSPQSTPNPPNASAGLSKATTLTATCPCHLFFTGFKTAVCPASNPQTLQTLPQAFPRQQLLQLHAPTICFSRGSRLPFARLQTLQTLPQVFPS